MLLVLTMAVALLAGCGDSADKGNGGDTKKAETKQETKSNDNASAGGDTAAASDEWTWPVSGNKEVSLWTWWSNDYATDPNELKGIQKIEEATGVHCNWVTVGQAEASEKFGLMMASGDYPDILRSAGSYYTGGAVQAVSDGVAVDLTDLVPKYMPTYMSLINADPEVAKAVKTDDGRMVACYTLASKDGEVRGESVWDGMCIREDWLKDLGLDVPVTIDDWHNVLTAFKNQIPGCDAPLCIGATNGYDICNNFLGAYGVLGEFYTPDGVTVKYGPLEDGYKQWVQLFRDWYAEGLIDQNFISNDGAFMVSGDYIGTGRTGAGANIWGFTATAWKDQGYTDDEDFFLRGVTAPVLNAGDTPHIGYRMGEKTKEDLLLTTNCKDQELALRWLDYWYTKEAMFYDSLGIEGESYKKADDGTFALGDYAASLVESGEYPSSTAVLSLYTLGTADFGLYNWNMFNLSYGERNRALEAYDYWDKGSYELCLPATMTLSADEQQKFNTTYTSIQTLKQEYTIKFITGQKDMSEYDSFVQQLKDYGIEDCISYQQAAFDRYNAR